MSSQIADSILLRNSIPWDRVFEALLSLVFVDFAGVLEGSLQLQLEFRCFMILPPLFNFFKGGFYYLFI